VVLVDGREDRAVAYEAFTGGLKPGDEVWLNTTAAARGLGSGGYHFVVAHLNPHASLDAPAGGHIMKLRYTPGQLKVMAVEEPESPFHALLRDADNLGGTPVVALELHSQVAPVAAAVWRRGRGKLRLVYIMTDGGALPLPFSRSVATLKEKGLLAATVTVGHAFGGEFEAVNVHSGLLAARHAGRADVIVVGMGPGVVGTETRFGTTAIEQGEVVNAAHVLGGQAVAALRIGFGDSRERHVGVSHHTITALGLVALALLLTALLTNLAVGTGLGEGYAWIVLFITVLYPVFDAVEGLGAIRLSLLFGRGQWSRPWWGLILFALSDSINSFNWLGGYPARTEPKVRPVDQIGRAHV